MDAVQHFIHMAYYNRRMNQQIIASCQRLSEQQLKQDKGAFFKSILGTLNHLWVGDRIWLARFSQHSTHYKSLDKVLALPNGIT